MMARQEFGERLLVQLRARLGAKVEFDAPRFALRVQNGGASEVISLASHYEVSRRSPQPEAAIADLVRELETRLQPQIEPVPPLKRLLWCVRSRDYLQQSRRHADLIVQSLGEELVAFIAEELPGPEMRGFDRAAAATLGEEELVATASANTRQRFGRVLTNAKSASRLPGDGWRIGGEELFAGSVLLVPEIFAALASRFGPLLVAHPQRSEVLCIAEQAAGVADFQKRVERQFSQARFPVAAEILRIAVP